MRFNVSKNLSAELNFARLKIMLTFLRVHLIELDQIICRSLRTRHFYKYFIKKIHDFFINL